MASTNKTPPGTPGRKADGPSDPSVKSAAYQQMEAKWAMILTLMGGTEAMRAGERLYLPQHAEESNQNYQERLERNTLFNMFELTLDSLVGKPFVEPVKLKADVPAQIVELATDVDLQGHDITSFCREWMRDAIAKGFSHVYIDMPVLSANERQNRTLADDMQDQRRPYWTLIRPEDMFFAYASVQNGVETLQHVRWYESHTELVGFEEVITQRIRIVEPGHWELWELKQTEDQKEPIWVRIEEGSSDMPGIPLVTYYANRTGFMTSKPPLEDLAYLNIRHWQSTADQINVLTVARFPMLAVAGAQMTQGQENNMAIGPRQLLATRDANGKFYYVEHTGKAIEAGRQDMQDLEDRMASYGAEFLRRKIGGRTATERALDSSEAISPLRDMTNRFVVAVNQALKVTAQWMNLDAGGTAEINTDFTEDDQNKDAIDALGKARERGDISRKTFLHEMKRLEVVSADLDIEKEMQQIEWEAEHLVVKPLSIQSREDFRVTYKDTGGPAAPSVGQVQQDAPQNGQQPATPPVKETTKNAQQTVPKTP